MTEETADCRQAPGPARQLAPRPGRGPCEANLPRQSRADARRPRDPLNGAVCCPSSRSACARSRERAQSGGRAGPGADSGRSAGPDGASGQPAGGPCRRAARRGGNPRAARRGLPAARAARRVPAAVVRRVPPHRRRTAAAAPVAAPPLTAPFSAPFGRRESRAHAASRPVGPSARRPSSTRTRLG